MISGKICSFTEKIIYKGNLENITTDSSVSRVVDKFGDFVAILIISKENHGIKHFKKIHDVTDRQLEIIQLTIDGHSNDAIGEKLGLARRTVETHLFNIYNKLGINNKVELAKIANSFNLF